MDCRRIARSCRANCAVSCSDWRDFRRGSPATSSTSISRMLRSRNRLQCDSLSCRVNNGADYWVEEVGSGFAWDNTLDEGNDVPTWPTAHQDQQAAIDWEAGRRD